MAHRTKKEANKRNSIRQQRYLREGIVMLPTLREERKLK